MLGFQTDWIVSRSWIVACIEKWATNSSAHHNRAKPASNGDQESPREPLNRQGPVPVGVLRPIAALASDPGLALPDTDICDAGVTYRKRLFVSVEFDL